MYRLLLLACAVIGAYSQRCPNQEGVSYIPDSEYCDRYTRCVDGEPTEDQCHDGLRFNELFENGAYPCDFANVVDCGSRTKTQPAQPTEHCPHQWALTGSGDSANCGSYWMCINGREYQYECPQGLAFNSATNNCDWPEDTPECDTRAFLGFSCPEGPQNGQIRESGFQRHADPQDCKKYFLCVNGNARGQTCPDGLVFNQERHECDEPGAVRGCETYYPKEDLVRFKKAAERAAIIQQERAERYSERIRALNSK